MTLLCVRFFSLLKTKNIWISNLIKSNQKKEQKLDDWQQQMIEKLQIDSKV